LLEKAEHVHAAPGFDNFVILEPVQGNAPFVSDVSCRAQGVSGTGVSGPRPSTPFSALQVEDKKWGVPSRSDLNTTKRPSGDHVAS